MEKQRKKKVLRWLAFLLLFSILTGNVAAVAKAEGTTKKDTVLSITGKDVKKGKVTVKNKTTDYLVVEKSVKNGIIDLQNVTVKKGIVFEKGEYTLKTSKTSADILSLKGKVDLTLDKKSNLNKKNLTVVAEKKADSSVELPAYTKKLSLELGSKSKLTLAVGAKNKGQIVVDKSYATSTLVVEGTTEQAKLGKVTLKAPVQVTVEVSVGELSVTKAGKKAVVVVNQTVDKVSNKGKAKITDNTKETATEDEKAEDTKEEEKKEEEKKEEEKKEEGKKEEGKKENTGSTGGSGGGNSSTTSTKGNSTAKPNVNITGTLEERLRIYLSLKTSDVNTSNVEDIETAVMEMLKEIDEKIKENNDDTSGIDWTERKQKVEEQKNKLNEAVTKAKEKIKAAKAALEKIKADLTFGEAKSLSAEIEAALKALAEGTAEKSKDLKENYEKYLVLKKEIETFQKLNEQKIKFTLNNKGEITLSPKDQSVKLELIKQDGSSTSCQSWNIAQMDKLPNVFEPMKRSGAGAYYARVTYTFRYIKVENEMNMLASEPVEVKQLALVGSLAITGKDFEVKNTDEKIKLDTQKGVLSWTPVENATSYDVAAEITVQTQEAYMGGYYIKKSDIENNGENEFTTLKHERKKATNTLYWESTEQTKVGARTYVAANLTKCEVSLSDFIPLTGEGGHFDDAKSTDGVVIKIWIVPRNQKGLYVYGHYKQSNDSLEPNAEASVYIEEIDYQTYVEKFGIQENQFSKSK